MIDRTGKLRWVWKSVPAPEFGENISRKEKVLQEREWIAEFGIRGERSESKWSLWRDVPEGVEEE